MSVSILLNRLPKARQTGRGKWTSPCPAHDDRSPSLGIRELDDGKILIHCFGGCTASEVLSAVGLSMEDLFPVRQEGYSSAREKRPFAAIDVLRCVAHETLIVAIAANSLAKGVELPEEDRKRLLIAASRLQAAVEVCNGDS